MAITGITITQNNKVGDSNLVPIQSPVIFLAEVAYTGDPPDVLNVEILNDASFLLDTYKAIPYRDLSGGIRIFAFIANDAIKSLMEGFEDFSQLLNTLIFVEDITTQFIIKFVDPDTPATFDEVLIDFVHGVNQFGENPNLSEQYNNDSDFYQAAKDNIVYVYFYNEDTANNVAIDGPVLTEENALDFDDSIFTDFDDSNFTIETIP